MANMERLNQLLGKGVTFIPDSGGNTFYIQGEEAGDFYYWQYGIPIGKDTQEGFSIDGYSVVEVIAPDDHDIEKGGYYWAQDNSFIRAMDRLEEVTKKHQIESPGWSGGIVVFWDQELEKKQNKEPVKQGSKTFTYFGICVPDTVDTQTKLENIESIAWVPAS